MAAEYNVTLTDSGEWLHAPSSDFLFAYIANDWNPGLQTRIRGAFTQALSLSSTIKQAVLETTGQKVESGLYLVSYPGMTRAMNSINGMGEDSVEQYHQSGDGTAASINLQFFTATLAGLGGDVTPMNTYLNQQMGNLQGQTKGSTVTDIFGTVIGLISAVPLLDDVATTFQYAFSPAATSEWFVSMNCGSEEEYSYNYSYTVVNYSYDNSFH